MIVLQSPDPRLIVVLLCAAAVNLQDHKVKVDASKRYANRGHRVGRMVR